MKFAIVLLLTLSFPLAAQVVPEGYILQYGQNFTNKSALSQFTSAGNGAISISGKAGNYFLQVSCFSSAQDDASNLKAIVKDYIFGEFIMEFDAMLAEEADSSGGLFTFFSYRDTGNYYFIKLASSWFDTNGGVFINNRNEVEKVAADSMNTWKLSKEKWTHFRLERNITGRNFRFYCADMKNPVIQATDPRLVMGYIGFGSFGGSYYIDNVKIWAPTFIPGQ